MPKSISYAGLFAIIVAILAFVRPTHAAASGEFINPNAGSCVTVPANTWYAGEEFWSAPNGDQRISVGSNMTTTSTEFCYTVDAGIYTGTRGVYASDAADAKVRAILLAEGEAANASLYKSVEVRVFGTKVFPNDERVLQLFVPNGDIVAGTEVNIQVYAPEYVQLTLDFGDGSPNMTLGPEHGLTQGVVNVPHVYMAGSYTVSLSDERGGRVVTQSAKVVANEQPTPVSGTLQIISGATSTGTKQYSASKGALLTFEASSNTPGTYCFYWDLQGNDKFCPDITVAGGKVTGQKIFAQNVTEVYVKLMTLDGQQMLDQVYIRFNGANQPDPDPTTGSVEFKNVVNPAKDTYGAIVSFDVCAKDGPFEGIVNFGDQTNSGLLGLAKDQCVRLEHVWENKSGQDMVFTIVAIRQGQTVPSATIELTIKPEKYRAYIPLLAKPFIAPTITVAPTTVSAPGQSVTIKVTAGSPTQIWVDYGNNRSNGGQMFAENQQREYTVWYEGDPARDARYPIVLSYKDVSGQVIQMDPIYVTTTFRR